MNALKDALILLCAFLFVVGMAFRFPPFVLVAMVLGLLTAGIQRQKSRTSKNQRLIK